MQSLSKYHGLSSELEHIMLRFVWNQQRPRIARGILKNENHSWGHRNARFQDVVIKTVWYWHKNRYIDQCNRIENPEIDPQPYGQLIFNKAGKNIQWKKDSLFNKWLWGHWKMHAEK